MTRLGLLFAVAACTDVGAGAGGRRDAVRRTEAALRTLPRGTAIELRVTDSLNSRHNRRGDPLLAVSTRDILDARNDVVIPAGARFRGRIVAIAPAERPGQDGVLEVEVTAVRVAGTWRPVPARVVGFEARMKGRGVTTGDAVKVGTGTAIGAVAGRVIGGNRTGTLVGAAAGTAAGAAYAHETRDIDIVLPRGAAIRIALTEPFTVAAAVAAGR